MWKIYILNNEVRCFLKDYSFINYLKSAWFTALKNKSIDEIIKTSNGSCNIAVLSVDMINGFCHKGNLASPRIKKIINPVINLFKLAHKKGIKNFVLVQDSHSMDAEEFNQFGPHCISRTKEADVIPEMKNLKFFNSLKIITKKTISAFTGTELEKYIKNNKNLNSFIVVGNCTDLCVYQLAIGLKVLSNKKKFGWNVIVPESCVNTYHMSLENAKKMNLPPHEGNIMHLIFLYHLGLNGIEVVREIVS